MKNQELIGVTAATLMEKIEGDYEDNASIAEVIIIVRVEGERDESGFPEWSTVQWRASDPIWTHQEGLIRGALEGMSASRMKFLMDEDDDEEED